MNDSLPPSRVLRTVCAAASALWWLLVAAWLVLLLAWGALHGWIVPRIGELRPALETQASKALGIPVRIGDISAHSDSLMPSFELRDVVLLDAQAREALRLPRVVVALSPRSLWNLGFEQLYIEKPDLDVRRLHDGRLSVAGLDMSGPSAGDERAADWFFSQKEVLILGGTVRWTDELRGTAPLALSDVELVVRNGPLRHALRIDATPPAGWGERFSLRGVFRQPLLSQHPGRWETWSGQMYADFGAVDLSRLRQYASLGVDVRSGQGSLRAWADVERGRVAGGAADVRLEQVDALLAPGRQPLLMTSVAGRLAGRWEGEGLAFETRDLQFQTADGRRWPGGNVALSWDAAQGRKPARGQLKADRLDLDALGKLASHLPLSPQAEAVLAAHAPKGQVDQLQASWEGPLDQLQAYQARGRLSQLTLPAHAPSSRPGVAGATIDFDLTQAGGKGQLRIERGRLELPGLLDEPVIPVDELSADLQWQTTDRQTSLGLSHLRVINADMQAGGQLSWKRAADSTGPGELDLQVSVTRADAARVWRYLPPTIPAPVRDYVREAVTSGLATDGRIRVRGDLAKFPFRDAKAGEFRISTRLRNVGYAYVPRSLVARGAGQWTPMAALNGELVFERQGMQLRGVQARFAGAPGLQVQADASIPDLSRAVVNVSGQVRGPLNESLGVFNASPASALIGRAFARTSASGPADIRLNLGLPLAQIERSTVEGSVTLAGNEIQVMPDLPWLTRARGTVAFSDRGFTLTGVQARALGGDVRIEGGTPRTAGSPNDAPSVIRVQGIATAEGLRQAREIGPLARLARQAAGSTPYAVTLTLRPAGVDVSAGTTLQGLALNLPAPLAKAADASLPVRLDITHQAGGRQDQVALDIGRLVNAVYVRDVTGAEPRVLRGSLAVGLAPGESLRLPDQGVLGQVVLGSFNADAWDQLLDGPLPAAGAGAPTPRASAPVPTATPLLSAFMPTSFSLRARDLTFAGQALSNLSATGTRDGSLWRVQLDAAQVHGALEYRGPSPGPARLMARLTRLSIPETGNREAGSLLDEQTSSLPALDVVVDNFELRGMRLGRLEIDAVVRPGPGAAPEWRLNRLGLAAPDANLTATGQWTPVASSAPTRNRASVERRRMALNFRLDVADGGQLLARLGMPDVVRRGRGKLEGQVAWLGSPLALDYPSLNGTMAVQIESGQFLKADPGLAKLLGVLSLQALPRRLTLDFRDVFSEGFSFDFIRGDVTLSQGIASTNNLQMKGVNAAVLMEGRADIARETQDLKVVVVPEMNAGTASLVASVINPAVGLGTFLAQVFLREPLMRAATQEFHVDGTWRDPRVTRVNRAPPPASPPPGN